MKDILLKICIAISVLIISISCSATADTSKYTQEQVLIIAKNLSPQCRKQIVYDGGSG